MATAVKNFSLVDVINKASELLVENKKQEAVDLYECWIAGNQGFPIRYMALFNLAVIYSDIGKHELAEVNYKEAIKINTRFYSAYFNLGNVLEKQNRPDEALIAWGSIVSKLSNQVVGEEKNILLLALNTSGRLLESLRRYPEAELMLERSLLLDPDQPKVIHHFVNLRQRQCKWPVLEPLPDLSSEQLFDAASALSTLDLTDDPVAQLAAAQRYLADMPEDLEQLCHPSDRYDHKKIKIGYLSSDFSLHPVSMLMVEVFELHNRDQFEVYGFCWSPNDGSPLRQRVISAFDHYIPIKELSDCEAAKLIKEYEIDVLIDLQGLTAGARALILARRPAPVQIAYLGFPGTSGMDFIDYVICDRYIFQEEYSDCYTEKPLYMSEVFQVCDTKREVGQTLSRKEYGLPEDAIVFCAFNNNHKYTPELFSVWLNILKSVPDSVLWLLADHPSVEKGLKLLCNKAGVSSDRLIFAPRVFPSDYLARYKSADLFLDCFPFNGGTTVNDALWMGLPVITYSGRSFASRMAGSLLKNMGLNELITDSFAEYENLAIALASTPSKLEGIKNKIELAKPSAALFNSKHQVKELEKILLDTVGYPDSSHFLENSEAEASLTNLTEIRKKFLHVGCGMLTKESTTFGFKTGAWDEVRFDINEAVKPDVLGTMTDLSNIADKSMDAIFSSHNIEHLFPHEVPVALKEFFRVLNDDGFLVITCPDLKSVCALVAEDKLAEPAYYSPSGPISPIDILYGHRAAMAAGNHYMAHKCGFTEKVLNSALQSAGFTMVLTIAIPSSFALWSIASKSVKTEDEMRALAALHFTR